MPANMGKFTRDHDPEACRKRLDEVSAKFSMWDKFKLLIAINKLYNDPTMKEKLNSFLSKKFAALLIGGILVTVLNHLGVSSEVTEQIVALVASYILGQSAVDATIAIKAKPPLKHAP